MEDSSKEKIKAFKDSIIAFNDTDEDLNKKLNGLQAEGQSLYSIKANKYEENKQYLEGTKKIEINGKILPRITNTIWPRVRSMVGIETDQLPKAVIEPPLYLAYNPLDGQIDTKKRDKLNKNAKDLEKWLLKKLQELKWQTIATRLYFQKHNFNDGYIMPYWDFENNDFNFENIHPKNVMIDQNSSSIREAEWTRVLLGKNRKYMVAEFGLELASQLTYTALEFGDSDNKPTDETSKTFCKLEMWIFDRFTIYRSGSKILKKIANPYYNFDSEGEQYRKFLSVKTDMKSKGYLSMFEMAKDKEGEYNDDAVNEYYKKLQTQNLVDGDFKVLKNYFNYPRKNLIQFKSYDTGEGLFSFPNFEQLLPMADDIEHTKQQIKRYRENVADPSTIYNSSEVTEEDAKKFLKRKTGQTIGIPLSDGNLRDNIIFDSGKEMPVSVGNNMQDSQRRLDETIGNNDVSRGRTDPNNETAEGIARVQQADQTPIRILTRFDEDAMQEVFEWCLQFIALFYNKDDHFIAQEDKNFGEYQMPITNEILTEGIKVYTKTGSTMPLDKESILERARNDAKAKLIPPQTYYETAEVYGDPKQQSYRLLNWSKGIVSDENPMQGAGMGGDQSQFANDPNVEQAVNQNKEMILGRNMDIIQGEDSRIHWDIHLQGIKEVEGMPEGSEKEHAKAAFAEHLQETQEKLASEGIDINNLPPRTPANEPAQPPAPGAAPVIPQ